MGKKSSIKSIVRIVANISIHKILIKYGNKPEPINHLTSEISTYRDTALLNAQEFNWNKEDKLEIEADSIKIFKKEISRRYPDVKFQMPDAERIIIQTIEEVIG